MSAGCFGAFFLSRILLSRCKFAHLQSRCLVQIAIVGGGAAGFFAAIACARADPQNQVSICERGSEFLTKVRISGGGRSEEHTSELQSHSDLVCRLLLEKKKKKI